MSVIGKYKSVCGQKRSVYSRIEGDVENFDDSVVFSGSTTILPILAASQFVSFCFA